MNTWDSVYNKQKKQAINNRVSTSPSWRDVMYPNPYREQNIANADYRGGLWRSMMYHTYVPKEDEMAYANNLWYSTMYGKGKEPIHLPYKDEEAIDEGMKYPFAYPNKLPRTSTGAIDYANANKALEDYLTYREGELNALGVKPDYPNKPKRTVVDRLSDVLNIGQYAVMGALYNATDKNPRTKWYEGFWEGLKSGNPLGEDYDKYEKSFSDVLGNLGWEKKRNIRGKWYKPWTWSANNVAHNLVSLAGNIFLDPLNYLSLGVKDLVGGTGKVVGKDVISETTEATAKQILKEVGEEATSKNVDEIIRQLDNLKGIKKGGRGISYGLQNVPFLNKIGGGKYNKTLVDADTIREFSDEIGLGGLTNQALTGIRESKLGRLFNTNVDLKQLARVNDVEAGKVLKFIDQARGRSIDLMNTNMETVEWVKNNLSNLSKDDQKLITDLLENKTKWIDEGVYKVPFEETEIGKQFKKEIEDYLNINAEKVSKLFDESYDGLSEVELDKLINEMIKNEKNEPIRELLGNFYKEFDEYTPTSLDDYYRYLRKNAPPQQRSALTRAMNRLVENKPIENTEVSKVEEIATALDELSGGMSINKYSSNENVNKIANQIDMLTNKTTKPDSITYEDIIGLFEEAKNNDVVTWRNYQDFYDKKNFDTVRSKFINENLFNEAIDIRFKGKRITNTYDKVNLLNEALFGGKEVISPSVKDYQIRDIYEMFIDGKPYDDIVELVDKNFKTHLSREGLNIHEHLRNTFGYEDYNKEILGRIKQYDDKIKKSITEQLIKDGNLNDLSPSENKELKALFKEGQLRSSGKYTSAPKLREFNAKVKELDKLNIPSSEKNKIVQELRSEYGLSLPPDKYNRYIELFNKKESYQRRFNELYTQHPDYKNVMKYRQVAKERDLLRDELFSKTPSELKEYFTGVANKQLDEVIEKTYEPIMESARSKFVAEQEAERVAKKFTDPIDVNKIRNDVAQRYFNVDYDELDKQRFIDSKVREIMSERIDKSLDVNKLQNDIAQKYFDMSYDEIIKNAEPNLANKMDFVDNEVRKRINYLKNSHRDSQRFKQGLGEITDDAREMYALYKDSIENVTPDVVNNIDFVKGMQPKEVKDTFGEFVVSLNDKADTADTIMESYKKLTSDAYDGIYQYFEDVLKGNYEGNLQEKYKLYYDALSSKEVFETLGRVNYGNDVVDSAMTKFRSIVVDGQEIDENIVQITHEVGKLFDDMFIKEMNAKVMSPDKFIGDYVYHMLTPEAMQFVKKPQNKGIVTDMFGFGGKFNVHNLSRKYEGTISEINDYMRNRYGIDKFFETQISDIYLARAMKHNAVMYDNKFTKELFSKFGKQISHMSELGANEKAIISYHDLKKFTYRLGAEDKAKVFKELGIAEEVLDTIPVPLIELDGNTFKKILPYSDGLPIYGVNDIMVEKANKLAMVQRARDVGTLLKLHDKFLHLYKMNVTAVIPGFHARNKFSNMFQNYLDIGAEAIHPKNQKQASDILLGRDGFIKTRNGKKISYEEIRQQMSAYGLTDSGYFNIDNFAKSKRVKKGIGLSTFNPLNAEDFFLYNWGRDFGGFIENQDKTVNFVANLKLGKGFAESAEHVDKFLFDYGDLTDFEMNVVKRIVPFYTWLRKNTPLQLEMMMEKPEIYRNMFKIFDVLDGSVDNVYKLDKEFLNEFAQDWIQIPGTVKNPEGREEPLLWNPNLPYDDVDRFFNPLTPVESTKKLVTQMNPLIKVPIELATNRNIFFDSDIEKYPGHTVNAPVYLDPIGHIKDEPMQISPKVRHILDQVASLQSMSKFFEKSGFDRAVHGVNTFGGVKVMSYDYEKYKYYMLQERLKHLEELERRRNYR